jgi:hypothetical protein
MFADQTVREVCIPFDGGIQECPVLAGTVPVGLARWAEVDHI